MSSWIIQVPQLALLALASCTSVPPPPKTPTSGAAKPAAQAESRVMVCEGIGPLSGEGPPSGEGDPLCTQIRRRIEGRAQREDVSRTEQEVVSKVAHCEVVTKRPGDATSGGRAAALVNVVGELGGIPAEGSYLVAQVDAGYCLVDVVLAMEWCHGGHFETDFELLWSEPAQLQVVAHRLKRIPLDSTQDAEDGADVDWQSCDEVHYQVADGVFRRTAATSDDGPCPSQVGLPRW